MRLLQVVASIDPASGGPAESIKQSAVHLQRRGHAMEVLSLDAPSAGFLSALPCAVHALGPSLWGYQYNRRLVGWLRSHARDYDGVIVNGLWQYHALGVWRALHGSQTPYVVYPHGMLDPWFKRTYPLKHLKKRLYWPWGDYRVLRDARAVLFTCEEERRLARESFRKYRAREVVVAFGTGAPPPEGGKLRALFLARYPGLRDKRLMLFLGRLQQKKGCDVLIKAYAQTLRSQADAHLVMAGPAEPGWQSHLQSLATERGVADRITWTGMLSGEAKWGALYASEAFVLPSHQENFGIAVIEAMACGTPVLISNKVNIWREIDDAGAGFVADDDVRGTCESLSKWQALSADERSAMGRRALALYAARYTADAMTDSLIGVIQALTPVTAEPAAPAHPPIHGSSAR